MIFLIASTAIEVALGIFAYEAYRLRFRKLAFQFAVLIVMTILLQLALV